MKHKPNKFISELLKGKSEQEMLEAEFNLRSLMQLAWDISCRENGIDPEGTLDFMGDMGYRKKSNCDVELSVDVIERSDKGVEIYLFTGDGDFDYLIR